MPIGRNWTRSNTAIGIVVMLLALTGWLIFSEQEVWLAADRQGPLSPATIENVLLRIDSNISRIQIAMGNLVFSEYPADLADDVGSINQLEVAIEKDFEEMGSLLPGDNAQYRKVLSLFREWKSIRDEAIRLTAAGPSPLAKEIVRNKSAAQVQEIRASLRELESFSQKRARDFDSDAFDAPERKSLNP